MAKAAFRATGPAFVQAHDPRAAAERNQAQQRQRIACESAKELLEPHALFICMTYDSLHHTPIGHDNSLLSRVKI